MPEESWDATSENGLLKSRLDEQSQLICLLKRRADDAVLQCQGLQRQNEGLEKKNGEAESLLAAERKRADQLEERFSLLADNHQEMICFKDSYKRQNEELRAECERLREAHHPELLDREHLIQELRAQLQAANTNISQQGEHHSQEVNSLQHTLEALREENRDRRQQLHLLDGTLKESQKVYQQVKEKLNSLMETRKIEQMEAERKMEELNKEKMELLQLCMERGSTLQGRQKELSELSNRLQDAEKARLNAEERYRRDVTAVDADSRVQQLNRRVADSEKQLEQLNREFEAYKKHSGELLAKERELNAKLRHLIG